jgi:hypothetical protein
MVLEICSESLGEPGLSGSPRTRCLNCGNVEDPVIRLNRTAPASSSGASARLREPIRL